MGWSKYGQTDGPRPEVVKVELKSSAWGDDQPEDQPKSEQTEQSQGRREEATRAPGYVPQASLSQHAVRIRERFRSSERSFVSCRFGIGRGGWTPYGSSPPATVNRCRPSRCTASG